MHAALNLAQLLLPSVAADANAPAQISAAATVNASPFASLLAHLSPTQAKTDLRAALQAGVAAPLPKLPTATMTAPCVTEAPQEERTHDVPAPDAASAVLMLVPIVTPAVTDAALPMVEATGAAATMPAPTSTPDAGFVIEQPEPATTSPVTAPKIVARPAPTAALEIPADIEIPGHTVSATIPQPTSSPLPARAHSQPANSARVQSPVTASHAASEIAASKAESVPATLAAHTSSTRPFVVDRREPVRAPATHSAIVETRGDVPKVTAQAEAKAAPRVTTVPVATTKAAVSVEAAAVPVQRVLPRAIAAQPIEVAHRVDAAKVVIAADTAEPNAHAEAPHPAVAASTPAAAAPRIAVAAPIKAAAKMPAVSETSAGTKVTEIFSRSPAERQHDTAAAPKERIVPAAIRAAVRIEMSASPKPALQASAVQRAPAVAVETTQPVSRASTPVVTTQVDAPSTPSAHASVVAQSATVPTNTRHEPAAPQHVGAPSTPSAHAAVVAPSARPGAPVAHDEPAIVVKPVAAESAEVRIQARALPPEVVARVQAPAAKPVEGPKAVMGERQAISARLAEPAAPQAHASRQPVTRVRAAEAGPTEQQPAPTASRAAIVSRAAAPHVQAAVQLAMPASLRAPVQSEPVRIAAKATMKSAAIEPDAANDARGLVRAPLATHSDTKPATRRESEPIARPAPAPVIASERAERTAPTDHPTAHTSEKLEANATPQAVAQPAAGPAQAASVTTITNTPNHAVPVVAQVDAAQPAQPTQPAHAAEQPLRLPEHASHDARAPEIEALAVRIAAKSAQGNKRFDILLYPPELGRIDVRLDVDYSGRASAQLAADKPQTLDLLQRDHRHLERALKDAGLDLGSMSFSLKGEERQHAPQAARAHAEAESRIQTPTIAPAAHVARWSHVADARVDIRI